MQTLFFHPGPPSADAVKIRSRSSSWVIHRHLKVREFRRYSFCHNTGVSRTTDRQTELL